MLEEINNSRTLSAVATIFLGLSMSACSTDRTQQETLQLWFPNQDLHQTMTTDELGNAAQSSREATIQLAIRLMTGDRTESDLERGYGIFKSLAESGDARAQFFLGTSYMQGSGVELDETIAVNWFKKSAEGGYD
ncbi:MAG: tetratricopeptide repeat protein, partial [Acidimicrobiales bacterium]